MSYQVGDKVYVASEGQRGRVTVVIGDWAAVRLADGRVRAFIDKNLQPLGDQPQAPDGPGAGGG